MEIKVLTQINRRLRSGTSIFSLRGRLGIIVVGVVFLAVALAGIFLFYAHQKALESLLSVDELRIFKFILFLPVIFLAMFLGITFWGMSLLIEKRRAEIIAASISDGILLLRKGDILYVNPIAEKILGLAPGAFQTGMKLCTSSDPANSGMNAVINAVSRTIPIEHSLEQEQKKFYYLIQSVPISFDLIEKVEHSVGYYVEQLLERFQADTLVLAQDVTLVRESQEAKSHFLATLSHEIKTPVTSLTMATRLLKRSIDVVPDVTHRNLILTCAENVDRLRVLLDDLMTVSRFDTLTQHLEIQKVDLAKLLLHSVQSFQAQAGERGIELFYRNNTPGRPIIVPMDATKVAWALSNLLINALRHTPRGGKVEARITGFEERVEVGIRDTGPGIEKARQEKIFDKFSSHYDLRVARSGGVGAGLAIAREIVVAHRGRIWVSSEFGSGAEFCFSLPLQSDEPSSVSVPISSSRSYLGLERSS